MKTCPFCAEEIQDATIVCKHCGRDTFRRAELPPIKEPISRVIKYGGGFLLAVIVLGVLLAVVSGNIAGPPSTNAVTMAKFQQLDTGMPYEDVRDLLGSGGTELSRSTIGDVTTVMYMWRGAGTANMNAMFQNNRLVSKAQFGLP